MPWFYQADENCKCNGWKNPTPPAHPARPDTPQPAAPPTQPCRSCTHTLGMVMKHLEPHWALSNSKNKIGILINKMHLNTVGDCNTLFPVYQ